MNKVLLKSGMVLTFMGAGAAAQGQDDGSFWGRFNLGYQAVFNLSAGFSGVGGSTPRNGQGQTFYNDGFVGVDSTHNAGGLTSYWGYDNASQISGGNVLMHGSALGFGTGRENEGPQNGVELSYDQPLGGGRHWQWGMEVAASWTDIGITDNRAFSGTAVTTTDAYSLGGATPPSAPYSGPYNGSGTLLDATPVSSATGAAAATVTGSRKIDANLFGFRLGPYVELPVCRMLSVQLGAGLSAGILDSDFSYNETVAVSGLPAASHIGGGHDNSGLIGGYARAQANLKVCHSVSLFAGAEFNDLGTVSQTAGDETAHLDLSRGIYVNGGLSVSF